MSADFGYQWLSQVSFSTTAGNFTENTARIYGTRTGGDDTILPHPNFSFDSYCVELGENISFGNYTHDVYNLLGSQTDSGAPFGAVHFDATRTDNLRKLWGNFSVNSLQDAAAFQLAQWEISFDSDLTLAQGAGGTYGNAGFMWADLNQGGVYTQAESMLSAIRGGTATRMANLVLLSRAGVQDQIVRLDTPGGPPGTVPEPFTMSLGLASAGMFIRRRLKAKKA